MSHHKTLLILAGLLVALALQISDTHHSSAGHLMNQTGCASCCPECNHRCDLDAKQGEVEKKCIEVETEVICIPRVVFPWQRQSVRQACDSCDSCAGRGCDVCCHNGAKTRKIKILKTKKYQCPQCQYTWSAEKKPCGSACCSQCDAPGCDRPCDGLITADDPEFPAAAQLWQDSVAPVYGDPASEGLETVEVQHP